MRLVSHACRDMVDFLAPRRPVEPYITAHLLGYLSPPGVIPYPDRIFARVTRVMRESARLGDEKLFTWVCEFYTHPARQNLFSPHEWTELISLARSPLLRLECRAWGAMVVNGILVHPPTTEDAKTFCSKLHPADLARVQGVVVTETGKRMLTWFPNDPDFVAGCAVPDERGFSEYFPNESELALMFANGDGAEANYVDWLPEQCRRAIAHEGFHTSIRRSINAVPWLLRRDLLGPEHVGEWFARFSHPDAGPDDANAAVQILNKVVEQARRGLWTEVVDPEFVCHALTRGQWAAFTRLDEVCTPALRAEIGRTPAGHSAMLQAVLAPGGPTATEKLEYLLTHGYFDLLETSEDTDDLLEEATADPSRALTAEVLDWLLGHLPAPSSPVILTNMFMYHPHLLPAIHPAERHLPWDPVGLFLRLHQVGRDITAESELLDALVALFGEGYRAPCDVELTRDARVLRDPRQYWESWELLLVFLHVIVSLTNQPISSLVFSEDFRRAVTADETKEGKSLCAKLRELGVLPGE